jgi:hypothetical protein
MAHAAMLLGGVVEAVQGLEAALISALDLPPIAADGGADVEAPAAASKAPADGATGPPTKKKKEPNPHLLWLGSLLAGLTGALVWARLFRVATTTLPACLSSRDARRGVAASRMVHFGVKYFVATSAALVATVLLLWKVSQTGRAGGERGEAGARARGD